ncbi:MAG: hypothetical protein QXM96_01200, partial [Candidatus Woesearchaeota archaeon]
MKKAQITLFLVIGLVVLILVGFFLFSKQPLKDIKSENKFDDTTNIRNYIYKCLEELSYKSIEKYGAENSKTLIEAYIKDNLKKCVDKNYFINIGFNVVTQEPNVNLVISEDNINFNLYYPLKLTKGSEKIEFNEFQFIFKKETFLITEKGIIKKYTNLISSDKKAILTFNEDTKAYDSNGNPVDKISLKVLDRNYNGLRNPVVVSNVIYEGSPDGLTFDKPVYMTIKLTKEDIKGIDTSALYLAYYDEPTGLWIAVPESVFDREKLEVRGTITHFSLYSVALCGGYGVGHYIIPMDFLVKDPFVEEVKDPKVWNYNTKLEGTNIVLEPNGIHIIPEKMKDIVCQVDSGTDSNKGKIFGSLDITKKGTEWTDSGHCINPDSEYIKDWDNDDQPNFDLNLHDYEGKFLDYSNNDVTTSLKQNIKTNILNDDRNRGICKNKCSEYAKKEIDKAFDWISSSNIKYISGDGIRDYATLHCVYKLKSDNSVDTIECDTDFYDKDVSNNLNDNNKNTINDELKTMEWVVVEGSDNQENLKEKLIDNKKFFATPKTFGMAQTKESAENPLKELNDLLKQNKVNELFDKVSDNPYYGFGEFTFNVPEAGSACLYPQNDVTAYLITEETYAVSTFDCSSDAVYERKCCEIKEYGELVNPNCLSGGTKTNRDCPNTADGKKQSCYEKEIDYTNVKGVKWPIGSYLNKINPIVTPLLHIPSIAPRILPVKINTELFKLLNYNDEYISKGKEEKPEQKYDWACSDACVWQLNENDNLGKLVSGENKVKVGIGNVKDNVLFARGFLDISGQGVIGFDECGTSIQDRINYLCQCTGDCDQSKWTDKDYKEYNCLAALRDKINADETRKQGNDYYYPHKISLCDVRNLADYYNLEICAGINFYEKSYANGGSCLNGKKYCRDQ